MRGNEKCFCASNVRQDSIESAKGNTVMKNRKLIRQASQSQLSQVIETEDHEFSRLVNTPKCKAILGKFFN